MVVCHTDSMLHRHASRTGPLWLHTRHGTRFLRPSTERSAPPFTPMEWWVARGGRNGGQRTIRGRRLRRRVPAPKQSMMGVNPTELDRAQNPLSPDTKVYKNSCDIPPQSVGFSTDHESRGFQDRSHYPQR